ncbi:MAG TPA: lysylphosphatidylglycerol synthase transmembrane domain-containing protein [Candidatus Sulfotelmatobacter sp.]|nr:lysylphosphatidylglycerol synthase transmembrane domain-containing protein [Candidatus Sulfotelmatobacter sp.]
MSLPARVRTTLILVVKLALSGALMTFLFRRIPAHEVAQALSHADRNWLIAAGSVMIASNLLGAYQWWRLLAAIEIRIPLWKVCAYYHVGLFFNNFLPANIGGDIARVADASRHSRTRAAAISTVMMDRAMGTLALAGLALVTTLPAIDRFHLSIAYLALVAFFALSAIFLWALLHPRFLDTLESVLTRVGLGRLKPHLDELARNLAGFRGQRTLLLEVLGVAVVVQVARIGVHVLVARSFGLNVPLPYFFLFVPLLAVIISLPISFNGIGLREGAGVVLFGLVGVGRAAAFSLQFTTYLVAVAVSLLGALIFLVRIPRRRNEARKLRRST